MLRILDDWSNGPDDHLRFAGQVIPVPSVIEDEHGMRVLFSPVVWDGLLERAAQAHVLGWFDPVEMTFLPIDGEPHEVESGTVDLVKVVTRPIADPSDFVHLHTHTEYSALDGMTTIPELLTEVTTAGQSAVAITDHGTCAGHTALAQAVAKAGVKPIYGIEAYLCEDRFLRPPPKDKEAQQKIIGDYWHLTLWAETDEGLRNLWRLSTEANRTGFYGRPRMDWALLADHAEGLLAGTGCLRGPVAKAFTQGGHDDLARMRMGQLLDIFGDGLFVELHCNQQEEQKLVNKALVNLASDLSLPVIGVTDSHYACASDAEAHKVWLAVATGKDIADDAALFTSQDPYHVMSEDEVRSSLAYLSETVVHEAIVNTAEVARRCDATISPMKGPPVFTATHREDTDRLMGLCLKGLESLNVEVTAEYLDRLAYEISVIDPEDFSGYFLITEDYCRYAHEHGILIGPGRGSGGGCLVAYALRIIAIDPIEADLYFERFLNPGRHAMPDFDVDFPSSKKDEMHHYLIRRWGEESVVRIGTHMRMKNRKVIRAGAGVLAPELDQGDGSYWRDIDAICKMIDRAEGSTAGFGLKWDEMMVELGEDLAPFIEKYPEIFGWASIAVGRLSHYGKHAAGLLISTDGPVEGLPMRRAEADEPLVTEWGHKDLEWLGFSKSDFLLLRTLDTLQEAIDLVEARHGVKVDPWLFRDEYDEPEIWDMICGGHTKGMFQIESIEGTKMCRRVKPRSIYDLSDVVALDRPGPMRSGLVDIFMRRRNGEEPVRFDHPALEKLLGRTFGCIVYQEDVMGLAQILAGYSLEEADDMRRILGKKDVAAMEAAGAEFLRRCLDPDEGVGPVERGTADLIWGQVREFAKYSFNRAHSWGYALVAHWCAWMKVHYPAEFMAALLSTVDKSRVPEFVREAARLGYEVQPPDVNESKLQFVGTATSVRYGLASIKGIGATSAQPIIEAQPYESFDDFMERSGAKADVVDLLVRVGAFDSIEPNRADLIHRREWDRGEEAITCRHKDIEFTGPNDLPCRFDWSSVPVQMNKKGDRPLKNQKGPPKACTRACWKYDPHPYFGYDGSPLTANQARTIEKEMLGIGLSADPLKVLPAEVWEEAATIAEADVVEEGLFLWVVCVEDKRSHTDRRGNPMGFVTFRDLTGECEVAVFKDDWPDWSASLKRDSIVIAQVAKTDRGVNLRALAPVEGAA